VTVFSKLRGGVNAAAQAPARAGAAAALLPVGCPAVLRGGGAAREHFDRAAGPLVAAAHRSASARARAVPLALLRWVAWQAGPGATARPAVRPAAIHIYTTDEEEAA
jgi:hypothetical protein